MILDPLPCEEEFPLVDSSGDGVFAAMAEFGLDPSAWLSSGPATVVTFDAARLPAAGAVAGIHRQHSERFGRPEDAWLRELRAVEARPSRRRAAAEPDTAARGVDLAVPRSSYCDDAGTE